MKAAQFGLVLLALTCTLFACSTGSSQISQRSEAKSEQFDDEAMSSLILYQYGKQLNHWKAQSPKAAN